MKVLVVVDMQNDFIDGTLGTDEAKAIVTAVRDKIDEYHIAGDTVLFTRDTHYENYLQTQEGRNLPVEHCIKGTYGWEISSELKTSGSMIIDKSSFGSCMLAEKLEEINASNDIEAIELVGLCTDICVISNGLLIKTKLPEIQVKVDASCCAGVTPESHETALRAMQACQIEVIK